MEESWAKKLRQKVPRPPGQALQEEGTEGMPTRAASGEKFQGVEGEHACTDLLY